MSMILKTSVEADLLRVVATGQFALEEAQEDFLKILAAVGAHNVKKVLLDGLQVVGDPSTMDRFLYAEFAAASLGKFADRGVCRGTQFAYVLKEPMLDPGRFGETIAVNRGMFVRIFDNLRDAIAWLVATP